MWVYYYVDIIYMWSKLTKFKKKGGGNNKTFKADISYIAKKLRIWGKKLINTQEAQSGWEKRFYPLDSASDCIRLGALLSPGEWDVYYFTPGRHSQVGGGSRCIRRGVHHRQWASEWRWGYFLWANFWFPGRKKHQEENKTSPQFPQNFVTWPRVSAWEAANALSLRAVPK